MKKLILFGLGIFILTIFVSGTIEKINVQILSNETILADGFGIVGTQYIKCNTTATNTTVCHIYFKHERNITYIPVNITYPNITCPDVWCPSVNVTCPPAVVNFSECLQNLTINVNSSLEQNNINLSNFSDSLKIGLREHKATLLGDFEIYLDKQTTQIRESIEDVKKLKEYEEKIKNLEVELKLLNTTSGAQLQSKESEIKILRENKRILESQNSNYLLFFLVLLVLFLLNFGLLDKIKSWVHGITYVAKK